MTHRGGAVGCEIGQQHEITCYKHTVFYLQPCVRVTYARSLNQSVIGQGRVLLVTHVYGQTLPVDRLNVVQECELPEFTMTEKIRVGI